MTDIEKSNFFLSTDKDFDQMGRVKTSQNDNFLLKKKILH